MINFCEEVGCVILPIDCFAILLVIDSVVTVLRLVWCPNTFQDLSENTCSEYRIPPQNTPEVTKSSKQSGFVKHMLKANITRVYPMGPFNRHVGLRTFGPPGEHPHPPPEDPIFSWFFVIFLGFLGVSLLNQRIFGISGVPGGGVNFPVFFQNLPWICAYGAWL